MLTNITKGSRAFYNRFSNTHTRGGEGGGGAPNHSKFQSLLGFSPLFKSILLCFEAMLLQCCNCEEANAPF